MSVHRSIASLCSLVALLCAASLLTAGPEKIVERVDVISVEVPVQVTLRGEPVRGLTADNFELYDGRKRREISGFRVVDLTLINAGELGDVVPGMPIAGRRHFLVVFDLSFSNRAAVVRAQRHIREWIAHSLHASDLVAVATFGVNTGANLLLSFTSDREQIDLAVATLGAPQLVERRSDPLGLGFGVATSDFLESAASDSELNGYMVAWDDDVLGGVMQDVFYGAIEPTQYAARRFPVKQLTAEFSGLARLLNSVRGRKHVVYLSEGFDSSLMFASDNVLDITAMNESVQSGELWRVDSTKRFGSGPTQSVVQAMLDEFRRSDCVIQAVDIKGYEEISSRRILPASADVLGFMAHETGGELYRAYANLSEALDGLLKATSVTYLLSFTPTKVKRDGSFHKLKIKLNNAPSRAHVVHRPGYYAPRPADQRGDAERRLIAGQLLIEGREGGRIDTSVLAAPFVAAEPGVRVPVLIEIDGPTLALGNSGSFVPLEIYAYAFDSRGQLTDFFTQSLSLDLKQVGPILQQSGLKFFGELDLRPGEYSLRVLVLNRESENLGLRVKKLEVPDFTSDQPVLLPPLFPERRGKWLLVRESSLESNPRSFPFMLADEPYLPAASPAIPERSAAPLHLLGYNLDAETIRVVGRVLAADGREVMQIDLPIHARAPRHASGPDTLTTSFSTRGLKAGLYTLVITIRDADSGAERSTSIPFAVTKS
jgi:VWFA-related protein